MKAPNQRSAILAATLAALVSGGVAFQALAEAPLGLRHNAQVDLDASAAGPGALTELATSLEASSAVLAVRHTLDAGQLVAASSLSHSLGKLSARSSPSAGLAHSPLLNPLGTANASLAAVATDERVAAMRASGSEGPLVANEAGLKAAVDLGQVAAALSASEGRLGFAQSLDTDSVLAGLRSDAAESAAFADAVDAAPNLVAAAASFETPALGGAFAAQTSELDSVTESLRSNPEDAALFDRAAALSGPVPDLAGLGNALAGYAIGGRLSDQATDLGGLRHVTGAGSSASQGVFSARASEAGSFLDALRAGGEGAGAAFAKASGPSTLDLAALAAALESDGLEQGVFSTPALSSDSRVAAMRAGDAASGVFSSEATSTALAVDFAAIGAALSEEE